MAQQRLFAWTCASLMFLSVSGCGTLAEGLGPWPDLFVGNAAPDDESTAKFDGDRWTKTTGWSALNDDRRYPLANATAPRWRWKHSEAAFDAACQSLCRRNDLRGWNAAILCAQYDPTTASDTLPVLARLVTKPPTFQPRVISADKTGEKKNKPQRSSPQPISLNMRAAAAEAWCAVLATTDNEAETALAPAGRALAQNDLPLEIRGELFRGIARHVQPHRVPGMIDTLLSDGRDPDIKAAPAEIRRAAIEACLIHAIQHPHEWPAPTPATHDRELSAPPETSNEESEPSPDNVPWLTSLWGVRWDSDHRIRKTFGELMAVLRHPEAFEVLKSQLNDQEGSVREAAAVSLGMLGSVEAKAELLKKAQVPEERVRMIAVRGLSAFGDKELLPFIKDKSHLVRGEVARRLARHQSVEASRMVRDLLNDANLDVQLTALTAIAEWEEDRALPLLLHSLAESSLKTRRSALTQLEKRRGERLTFPLDAAPRDRALAVAEWSRQWAVPDALVLGVHELSQQGHPRLDALRVTEIRERLETLPGSGEAGVTSEDSAWFQRLAGSDVPNIEQALAGATPAQAEYLLRDVLPRLNPAYDALQKLTSTDVTQRRRGGQLLSQASTGASLSPVLLERLAAAMKHEQDQLVWRYVLQAVLPDSSDAAARLALLAINNPWPDVRVVGCEFVARHGRSDHAAWVLPLLHDDNHTVQLAAVAAAGRCRNPLVLDGIPATDDTGTTPLKGLRPLLNEAQGQLRFAAVASMSQCGDAAAMQELMRLAFDSSYTVRASVAQAMGESGQSRFIEPLIRLAWTESNQTVKHAAVSSLKQLVPPDERPPQLAQAAGIDRTVEVWVAWWETRRGANGGQ